jgi:DeoR family glycerol-3-phosphate regulon repressor
VSVDDLSARFDVTPQTIRRDLNELCERRVLTRIHGGAGVSSCVENLSYDARRFIAAAEKKAIGIAAVALIPNKSSLFINIGTTAEEVAAAPANHDALLVVTNNLNEAMTPYRRPSIEVIVAGAPARGSDGAVVGSATVDLIRRFKVDTAGIGSRLSTRSNRCSTTTRSRSMSRAPSSNAPSSWSAIARSSSGRRPSASATCRRSPLSSPTGWIPPPFAKSARSTGVNIIETDAGAQADQ